MPHSRLAAFAALLAVGACARASSPLAATASAALGNACDRRLVTQADVGGLLAAPITREKTLAGDGQSCVFEASDFSSITISLRPGLGKATLDSWLSGQMNLPVTPVAGVGDRAVWQPSLHEIIASKANMLCDIGVMGPPTATSGATPEREGALCSKIFAARRA